MPNNRIYWLDTGKYFRLAIMARPRGDDWLADEVTAWRTAGIATVVSLLEPNEVIELGLQKEHELCSCLGIELLRFPMADRGVPRSVTETIEFARCIGNRLSERRAVAIHCRAGIGRASLMAGCVLVNSGILPDEAFARIAETRGLRVPDTDEQRYWLTKFSKELADYPDADFDM